MNQWCLKSDETTQGDILARSSSKQTIFRMRIEKKQFGPFIPPLLDRESGLLSNCQKGKLQSAQTHAQFLFSQGSVSGYRIKAPLWMSIRLGGSILFERTERPKLINSGVQCRRHARDTLRSLKLELCTHRF